MSIKRWAVRRKELQRILEDHRKWVTSGGTEGRRANLRRASLVGAHLKRADLRWAHLDGVDLTRANLEGARLGGAGLKGTILTAANLRRAILLGAHLQGADLRWAYLEGAELCRAWLRGAILSGSHLEGAKFKGAHLEGAVLGGDHLDARGLIREQLEEAYGDERTVLPSELADMRLLTPPGRLGIVMDDRLRDLRRIAGTAKRSPGDDRLSLYFDLDTIAEEDAARIIHELSEFIGERLHVVSDQPLPPPGSAGGSLASSDKGPDRNGLSTEWIL